MPFADLPHVRLHYEVQGASDTPWLICSHSLGSDLSMWDGQVSILSKRFRVLRYDARGHGQSSVPPGPYTLAQMGQDVLGLMDHLQIKQAHFCGLSMGGLTGLWLALHHPGRLRKLAACNTAARVGSAESWADRVEQVQREGMAALAAHVVARWFSPAFVQASPAELGPLQAVFSATSPQGYIATCEALAAADLRASLPQITLPVLVVGGEHDVSTPMVQSQALAGVLPDARLLQLPAGHLSNVQQPAAFNAAMLDFFGES